MAYTQEGEEPRFIFLVFWRYFVTAMGIGWVLVRNEFLRIGRGITVLQTSSRVCLVSVWQHSANILIILFLLVFGEASVSAASGRGE